MLLTVKPDARFRCDGCGRDYGLTDEISPSIFFGLDNTWIDFCSAACFELCMLRGGMLHDGRVLTVNRDLVPYGFGLRFHA